LRKETKITIEKAVEESDRAKKKKKTVKISPSAGMNELEYRLVSYPKASLGDPIKKRKEDGSAEDTDEREGEPAK